MLNLLPQSKKKEIQREYKTRRLILFLGFVSAAIFISTIFIFPTFLMAKAKNKDLNSKNTSLDEQLNIHTNTNFNEIQTAMIDVLGKNDVIISPTSLLDSVTSSKGDHISITDMIIQNDEESLFSVHGIADTREDLIAFKQALQSNPNWSSVDLPINDLGPAKENEFSITLTVAKPQ